jgi:hypothetical protein
MVRCGPALLKLEIMEINKDEVVVQIINELKELREMFVEVSEDVKSEKEKQLFYLYSKNIQDVIDKIKIIF